MTDHAPEAGTERDKRSGVILRAMIDVDGLVVERRVRNLSVRGACVDNDGDLIVGSTVLVTMGELEALVAEVMWAKPSLAGLRFHRSIDLEAARKPRGRGLKAGAGWMTDIDHAYRKRA
ncbi:PilZ domain-containing protein [Sphingomonas rubra]|uniref:PilZ domain-containing protein n=1 Tax=Sphingomonas rubra TaxID=634430 RepID=A0A1I5TI27_9SPHN|nr:PilZ domain-containing protein [Sphingomonas rubra]SFP82675.1 PilZ domain-containing protein [Sphingomonas rubra]